MVYYQLCLLSEHLFEQVLMHIFFNFVSRPRSIETRRQEEAVFQFEDVARNFMSTSKDPG